MALGNTISDKFLRWSGLKIKLHIAEHAAPYVSERDLWWASFGENIGSEINGKNQRFTRPALIIKKLAHKFYLVAPTTTKVHKGSWYVRVTFNGIDEYICLHQIRAIDYRRLDKKLGQITISDFEKVSKAFLRLYI